MSRRYEETRPRLSAGATVGVGVWTRPEVVELQGVKDGAIYGVEFGLRHQPSRDVWLIRYANEFEIRRFQEAAPLDRVTRNFEIAQHAWRVWLSIYNNGAVENPIAIKKNSGERGAGHR